MEPNEMRYTETHEWARVEEGSVLVGLSDYAAEEVGDIVFIEFEEEDEVTKGEPFGVLETVKAVFDLNAPVSGSIIGRNTEIEENPDMIKNDPFGEGWIIRIDPADEEEFEDLMTESQYEEFKRKEE